MNPNSSDKKAANGLMALSVAAVLAVYTAGYTRTRSAANRIEAQAERRPGGLHPLRGESPIVALPAATNPSERASSRTSTDPAVAASNTRVSPISKTPSAPATSPIAPAVPPAANQGIEPAAEHNAEVVGITTTASSPAAPSAAAPPWKDGKYSGWGTCRHGDIQAEVVIASGRIVSAAIAQCLTRYSCSVIDDLPPEVADRQSPDVDSVSGATQSSDAFYWAVFDALSKAK